MKKYQLLHYLFKNPEGVTASFLSEKLNTAVPNIYTYANELREDGFIKKKGRLYTINLKNKKVKKLLILKETFPKDYLFLISPQTKKILDTLSKKIEVEIATELDKNIIKKIRRLHQLKIVLITKNKPVTATLRVDEAVTKTLLDYFEITPLITPEEYRELLSGLKPKKIIQTRLPMGVSYKKVKYMCDKYFKENKDYILNQLTPYTERIQTQLTKVEEVNKQYAYYLNSLPPATRDEIEKQWIYKYVYNTNSIEGNPLTHSEVTQYITTGIAPYNANKKDLNETRNTNEAIKWVFQNSDVELDENLIKTLHYFIEKGINDDAGHYKHQYNLVGNHPTTPPKEVEGRMKQLMKWYNTNKNKIHPIILASIFHQQFVMIHPFFDGNGRVARLIFCWILIKNNYLPIIFEVSTKTGYYQGIENQSINQFVMYITTQYIHQYLTSR